MNSTLILNADGQPVSLIPITTVNWKEAINLIFSDQAEVLSIYEDWDAHSPSTSIDIPSVLMLRTYVKYTRAVKFSRENIYLRDDFTCQYCGNHFHTSDLSLDHVTPRFLGGKTSFSNIVTACHECNSQKAHYTKMKPLKKPRKPSYYELANTVQKYPITIPSEDWIPFLGWEKHLITVREPNKKLT